MALEPAKRTKARAERAAVKTPAKGRAVTVAVARKVARGLDGPRMSPGAMHAMRDLFWYNVVRDMLNGLTMLSHKQPELFDGRFGILTRRGERIPVAGIAPMFACSIPGSPEERDASAAVQCTVFQVTTPDGEVFTLPVHEIRGLHTMTQELLEKLQNLAEDEETGDKEVEPRPFGLAAFAALPKPMPAVIGMPEWLGE